MRHFSTLLLFHLRTIPLQVWSFVAISLVPVVFFTTHYELSGFDAAFMGYSPLYYTFITGIFYLLDRGVLAPIAHQEFLFTRPLSRKSALHARTLVFFFCMLGAPILNLCLSLRVPDMSFTLFQDANHHPEAAEKLAIYQAAFPEGVITKDRYYSYDSLVIPHGWLYLAGWHLLMALLVALTLLMTIFLPLKSQLKKSVLLFGMLSILGLIHFKPAVIQPLFFQFARHWGLAALIAIALVYFVERFGCKRIRDMEVA